MNAIDNIDVFAVFMVYAVAMTILARLFVMYYERNTP